MRYAVMRSALAVLALLTLATGAKAQDPPPARRPRPFLRGVCLTLHDEDPERDYSPEVAEIASRTGASHVSVVFHLYQKGLEARAPARAARTPSDAALHRIMVAAREHKLGVLLMPVVLLEDPKAGEWRGILRPGDPAAWFAAYESEIVRWAKKGAADGAAIFCVGSELGWSHGQEALWRHAIAAVRAVFPGELTYSANWDAYASVPFWDALDHVGLSGYQELAKAPGEDVPALRAAWDKARGRILAWRQATCPAKSLLFTELGYPSQPSAAMKPWSYLDATGVDLETQRRCYEAFVGSWAGTAALQGVFFYEWWGEGGPEDSQYTPRGKPAEVVIRRFFGDLRVVEARR
jgi:hypothetical protein